MALKFTTKSTKQPNRTICFRAGCKRFNCVFHLSLKIVLNLSTNLASRGRVKAFSIYFRILFRSLCFSIYTLFGKNINQNDVHIETTSPERNERPKPLTDCHRCVLIYVITHYIIG